MSRPLPHLALVPLLASLTVAGACARDPLPAAPPATAAAAASEPAYRERVRRRLEGAAAGLLYMSESDYPFTYYFRPARIDGELRLAEFRTLEGIVSRFTATWSERTATGTSWASPRPRSRPERNASGWALARWRPELTLGRTHRSGHARTPGSSPSLRRDFAPRPWCWGGAVGSRWPVSPGRGA